jgi:hypothetical protein
MVRFFGVPIFLSIIATIIVSQVLAIVLAIPVANLSASFMVAAAMICFLVLQRRGLGPKHSLLKQQYFLYATVFGPTLLFFLFLSGFVDRWLGVSPGRISLIGLVSFFVIVTGLRFLLPRVFFNTEERMEINAQGKALTAIEKLWTSEKLWASRSPLSLILGARTLRNWSGSRS